MAPFFTWHMMASFFIWHKMASFFIWHKIPSLLSWYKMLFALRLLQDVLPSSTDSRFLYVFIWHKTPFSWFDIPFPKWNRLTLKLIALPPFSEV
jgi:hypothetical protein